MDKQTKNKIKSMVLALREDFEKEIANRLNNMGISPDREWKDGRSLPHLSEDEIGRNELEKRRRVAAFINREIKAGQSQKAATEEFIREASYTWVNRLLGLKCLESQDLIKEVITTRPEYGNRSKQHRDFREKNPEAASKPDDGLIGCLFSAFKAITEEIRVLFDPEDEYSLIIPRYPVLKNAIEKINTQLDYETYQADDFLGWVYQYFNSKEKDKVFEEVRTKKKKIAGNDIINATQLYTEKYMVHFLVENSLGAIWMEMYPNSPLSSRWEYFVKDPNDTIRETKPVKEIKFLDPACGSGHFLLYAFDLFYAMYEEEGIIPRDQIPEFILKNNLHGIDIDQRAIQLSALGLYMKAKSKNSDMKVQQTNLVSANAVMLNSDILEEFLQDFKDDEIAQKLITTIWHGLSNVRELGSLLKIEEQIDEVIEKRSNERLDFFVEGGTKNWGQWKLNLTKAINKYYMKVSKNFDINKQLFASEAYKGVQFLDLLEQRYDVVATNPPYITKEKMSPLLADYLTVNFSNTEKDIYAAFMERNLSFLNPLGKIAMINLSGFLFQGSLTNFRKLLLDDFFIEKLSHLGFHSFEGQVGHDVNTAMFVITNKKVDNQKISVFFRNTEAGFEDKWSEQLKLINTYNKKQGRAKNIYLVSQKLFLETENYPIIYRITRRLLEIFNNYNGLSNQLKNISKGITVTPTDKTIRCWWEICDYSKFMPATLAKEQCRYYGHLEYSILLNEKIRRSIFSREINKIQCIVYNETSRLGFGARIKPLNYANEFHSISVIPGDVELKYLLGFLNSIFVRFILDLLNDTNRFCTDDVKRIPYKKPTLEIEGKVSSFVEKYLNIKKSLLKFKLSDRDFIIPAIEWGYERSKKLNKNLGSKILTNSYKVYLSYIETEQVKLLTYDAIINYEIFHLYDIKNEDLERILREQSTPAGYFPLIEGFDFLPEDMSVQEKEYVFTLPKIELKVKELESLGKCLIELYTNGISIEDISLELKINPISIISMREELDIISDKDLKNEVENIISYFVFGRLNEDKDGIIPLSQDMTEKTMKERIILDLEKVFGEELVTEILSEIKIILGKDLEGWLSKEFFKKHISQYKKRPIVWHLKSEKGYFEVFLYYHKLNNQTLHLLKNVYLSNLLNYNERKVKELKEQQKSGSRGNGSSYKEIEEREKAIDDLNSFGEKLKEVMDRGISPVIDDGVLANIAPYQKAGLLAADALDENQLSKGLELLNEYIKDRKAECKAAIKMK